MKAFIRVVSGDTLNSMIHFSFFEDMGALEESPRGGLDGESR
jgi:hypothetical protein